jgi:hypothetical protein
MFRHIGEIFEDGGVKLKVVSVESFFCDGCYYQEDGCELQFANTDTKKACGQCGAQKRDDNKNVIFKEV